VSIAQDRFGHGEARLNAQKRTAGRPYGIGIIGQQAEVADRTKTAAVDAYEIGGERGIGRGRDEIDRAAESRCAKTQGIAIFENLDRAEIMRIDSMEIAAAVRNIRNSCSLETIVL
jgi:hypothetical protein